MPKVVQFRRIVFESIRYIHTNIQRQLGLEFHNGKDYIYFLSCCPVIVKLPTQEWVVIISKTWKTTGFMTLATRLSSQVSYQIGKLHWKTCPHFSFLSALCKCFLKQGKTYIFNIITVVHVYMKFICIVMHSFFKRL